MRAASVIRRASEIEQTIVTITMITSVVKTLWLTAFPPDRGQPDPRFADIESCPEPQDGVEELRVALIAHRGVPLHLIIRDHAAEPGLAAWIAAELR